MWNYQKQQKCCFPLRQTYKPTIILNKIYKNWTRYRRQVVNPRHQTPPEQSVATWECKHDIKESKGNMFNPIFKENVQGRKHPGSCALAESELLRLRKPKM